MTPLADYSFSGGSALDLLVFILVALLLVWLIVTVVRKF